VSSLSISTTRKHLNTIFATVNFSASTRYERRALLFWTEYVIECWFCCVCFRASFVVFRLSCRLALVFRLEPCIRSVPTLINYSLLDIALQSDAPVFRMYPDVQTYERAIRVVDLTRHRLATTEL